MNHSALSPCPSDIDPSSYSCANPFPNCTNPAAFQFASLWLITQAVAACPDDTRLFQSQPMLTDASCRIFTHKKSWTPYPGTDIWARLTTWKFPLLQLVAVFPRPPLTLLAELFVLVHLMGDPISTISNLLLKIASCQARAVFWKYFFEKREIGLRVYFTSHVGDHPSPTLSGAHGPLPSAQSLSPPLDSIWKGLAAIVDSYDEWGIDAGNDAQKFIETQLNDTSVTDGQKRKFLKICRLTANALAADRATKFLPIIVAQVFFIGTIAIAFGRTKTAASGPTPASFINIEAHSIAFSSLYFWIIPAVMISSIIGVSQTEAAVPRILRRFRNELQKAFEEWEASEACKTFQEWDITLLKDNLTTELRERSGGVYSWYSEESRATVKEAIRKKGPKMPQPPPDCSILQRVEWLMNRFITLRPGSYTFPSIIFIYGASTGLLISYLVPPVGFECRHIGELAIVLTWIFSAVLNKVPLFRLSGSENAEEAAGARRSRFLFILWKDIIATVMTMGGIIITQVGIFNQCACYTLWGKTGLALPENNSVGKTLSWRISRAYPAIAFLCVGFQLVVVPILLLRQYRLSLRVFLQRDDEKSNLPRWAVTLGRWMAESWKAIGDGVKKLKRASSGETTGGESEAPGTALLDTNNQSHGEDIV